MHQITTATRKCAQEFKQCAQDMDIDKKNKKVYLILPLNYYTLSHLDVYATMRGGDKMTHLETIQDRLYCILYI